MKTNTYKTKKYTKTIVSLLLVMITLLSSLTGVLADSVDNNEINYKNIINLVIGQSYIFKYDNEEITDCTSSNKNTVVAVSNGTIIGMDYGTADITVTTNSSTYTYKVNVIKKELKSNNISLFTSESISLKSELKSISSDNTEVTEGEFPESTYEFTSENPEIVTVSEDGIITALSEGTTNVTIKVGSDKNILICSITVISPYLDTYEVKLNAGETKQIKVHCGQNQNISYSSSNTSIVTVDSEGNITGLKKGTATISINVGDIVLTCSVTVNNNPTINYSNKTIYVKHSFTLKVKGAVGKVTYTTNNNKIATVDNKGKVTGKGKGTCNIIVTVNGVKLRCTVVVIEPIISYQSKIYIKKSTKISIKGKVGNATFSSSNKKVAKVDRTGKITGVKKGHCTIIIKVNGLTLKRKITVINPTLNKKSLTLTQGKSFQLKVNGGNGKIKYTSSNTKIASVNKYGKIYMKNAGTCKITVTRNGIKLVCKIKVTPSKYPVGLSYKFSQKRKSITRHQKETFYLSSYYTIKDNAKSLYKKKKCSKKQYKNVKLTNLVKFSSNKPSIVAIFPNGKIVAKKKGNCTITATLYNKKVYTYSFKIVGPITGKTLKNGKKVKYVYSYNQLLNELVNEGKQYNIKGLKSPYYGYACMFKNNFDLTSDTYSKAANKIENDLYKLSPTLFHTLYELGTQFDWYTVAGEIINSKEINAKILLTKKAVTSLNANYKIALNILKKLKINTYTSTNDKIYNIINYLHTYITYSEKESPTLISNWWNHDNICSVSSLTVRKGVCEDYSWCTMYLCYLANIDCYVTMSDYSDHQANVIKADNGKFYYFDATGNVTFYGKRQLATTVDNKSVNEYASYAKRFYGVTLVERSYPYLTPENKKSFNTEVPTKDFLEWAYGDCIFDTGCTYICDEEVLRSLGIKPTN